MPHHDTLKPRPPPLRPSIAGTVPTDMAPSGKSYGQMIIDQVNQGIDVVNAAAAAGVSMAQLGDWTREGQTHYARYLAGADWATDFTAGQQDAVEFHTRLSVAMAQHKSRLALIAEQLARGGLERRRVRRKTSAAAAGGQERLVEETVTVETFAPDADMVRWKLERLQPDVYGARARIDVMVHDLTDSDESMDIVSARVAAIRKQLGRDEPIEATATEDLPGG